MSDRDLSRLFDRYRRRGDARALAEIFDRTGPELFRIASHLAGRSAEAEDLLQATFVTAIERASSFDATRPLLPWLTGILAHHGRNAMRKASHLETRGDLDPETGPPALDRLLDREERSALIAALDKLPEPYREVMTRRLRDGLPAHEIARQLGRAPGTVRIQVHRGLALLKKSLPKSLLAGAGILLSADRGLAAIRVAVLEHAASSVAAPAAVLGGLVLTKKLLTITAVAVAALVYVAVESPWSKDDRTEARSGAERPSSEPPPSADAPAQAEVDARREPGADVQETAAPTPVTQPIPDPVRVFGRALDRDTGEAVEGATVWLYMGRLAAGYSPRTRAQTGADGRFELRESYDHFRTVQVDSPQHARFSAEIDRPARETALEEGIDLGDLALSEGTRITGRVVNSQAEPIADAVLLLHEGISFPTFFPAGARQVGRSVADGSFSLERLPASDFTNSRLFAVSEKGSGCTEVIILSDVPLMENVEIQLKEIASLSVEVLDEKGDTVPDALVTALPVREPYVDGNWAVREYRNRVPFPGRYIGAGFQAEVKALFECVTDEAGLVRFPSLPLHAPVTLKVSSESHVTVHVDIVELKEKHNQTTVSMHTQVLRSVSGRVLTMNRKPLSDARVRLYPYYQSRWNQPELEVEVDPEGHFLIEEREAGTSFHLVVVAEGFAMRPFKVEVPIDRDITGVELVATRATPFAGVVVDSEGEPVAGASAALQRVTAENVHERVLTEAMQTGEDGRFAFPDATEGEWTLNVGLPGVTRGKDPWRQSWLEIPVDTSDEFREVVAERVAAGGCTMIAEVVDAKTGEPLDPVSASVGPVDVGSRWSVEERSPGQVKKTGLVTGRHELRVEVKGYPARTVEFDVTASDLTVRPRVEMLRPGRVSGRVLLGGLPRPEKIWVFVNKNSVGVDSGGVRVPGVTDRCTVLTDTLGFYFVSVAPGPVEFSLVGKGIWGRATIEVESDGNHTLDIEAVPSGAIVTRGVTGTARCHLHLYLYDENDQEHFLQIAHPATEAKDLGPLTYPAGAYRYELRRGSPELKDPGHEDLRIVAEGELEILPGQETAFTVPRS